MADILASIDDLAAQTGLPAADPRLVSALSRASGRFIADVGHKRGDGTFCLLREEADAVDLNGTGTDTLLLPSAPVVGNVGVAIAGVSAGANAYTGLDRRAGILRRAQGWPEGLGNITITYSHGYLPGQVPADIQSAVLERAAMLATTQAHVSQESGLSQSVSNFAQATVGVTQEWADAVNRYSLGVRS